MASARSNARTESERDFDRDSEGGHVTVVNVSPFPARFEIGTMPGTPPRKIKLEPGEQTQIQRGYAIPTISINRQPQAATIEALTAREAWPGQRSIKAGLETWHRMPGPQIPMVVHVDRATDVKAQWDEAMFRKLDQETAPPRIVMQRSDGTQFEVEATIEPARITPTSAAPVGAFPLGDESEPAVIPPAAPSRKAGR